MQRKHDTLILSSFFFLKFPDLHISEEINGVSLTSAADPSEETQTQNQTARFPNPDQDSLTRQTVQRRKKRNKSCNQFDQAGGGT